MRMVECGLIFQRRYVLDEPQLLGSCNGLVGLSVDHGSVSDVRVLCLWNPSTGESKYISHPHPYIQSSETLGFVYDSNSDDYKFVRIINNKKTCRMDMYSLRNNSWKLIKESPPGQSEFELVDTDPGIGVNGYLFWLAYAACELGYITEVLIVKLCLTDYCITVSKLPREMIDCTDGIVQLTGWSMGRGLIAMGNNCLAAYAYHKPGIFVVWTSKLSQKNEIIKWKKLIHLPLSSPVFFWVWSVRPAWFTKDGKVVLFMQGGYPKQEQEQHKFGLYDPLNKTVQCFRMFGGENNNFNIRVVLTHTESLLSPNMYGCKI